MCDNTENLNDLLNSWELSALHSHFVDNGVGIYEMENMNATHLSELMAPFQLGIRIVFQHKFEEWRLRINKRFTPSSAPVVVVINDQRKRATDERATQTEKPMQVSRNTMTGIVEQKSQMIQTMPMKFSLNNIKNLMITAPKIPVSLAASSTSRTGAGFAATPLRLSLPSTASSCSSSSDNCVISTTNNTDTTITPIANAAAETLNSDLRPMASVELDNFTTPAIPTSTSPQRITRSKLQSANASSKANNSSAVAVEPATISPPIAPKRTSVRCKSVCSGSTLPALKRSFNHTMAVVDIVENPDSTPEVGVMQILKESGDKATALIEQHKKNKVFSDSERLELIKIIAHYYNSHNLSLPLQKSHRLEEEILALFPGEKLKNYRSERRGKLYMRYRNTQRNYNKGNNTVRSKAKHGKISKAKQRSGTFSCYAPSLPDVDDEASRHTIGDMEELIKNEHFSDDDIWTMGYD